MAIRLTRVKTRALTAVALLTLALSPSAHAKVDSVLGGLTCTPQPDQGNVRQCGGIVHTFDGAPIDVNVTLPPEPASVARGDTSGAPLAIDGNYPLLGMFHGWGGSKLGLDSTATWAKRGYAVFTMSDRGWGDSCGGQSQTRLTE